MNYNILTLDIMKNMSIDDIIILYKNGYRLDDSSLKTLQFYDCSGPMLGALILGLGLGGIITTIIIKSYLNRI